MTGAMRKPTPDELRRLKDKAAEAAAKGKLDKAADLYREAAEADPKDVGTRQKLAEALRRAGRLPEAIQAYGEVADRFGKDGLLIKAIAISKMILELDPRHVETQSALAELYSKKAAVDAARPPPRTMMMQAMKAVADDGMVALRLEPPPAAVPEPEAVPLEILFDTEPVPEAAPPGDEPATEFERIVFAAEAAVQAGLDEDLLIEADPIDAEIIGDEPLALESLDPSGRDATVPPPEQEPLEILVEPEPAPESAAAPPQTPVRPPLPPAARPVSSPPVARTAPPPARAAKAPARPPPPPPPGSALPRVPIFSDLSRDAFVELTSGMVLHRIPEGDPVIREGEDGTSFYVVASGRFAVSKRDEPGGSVVLARLGEGDFFGEMALLSGAARSASVTAEEDGEVLEFRADVLLGIAGRHPHVAQSLRRFYRQRLLANALAVSPIFRPFQRGERKLLMERFRAREVADGEVIIREGQASDGLYVLLEGAVDVVKRKDAQDVVVGHLREGDLFGEMSCLRKAPASASIVVRRSGTLLRLPRKDFDELVVTYPQILELVASLSEERAENLDAILTGHAEWTDDGLVLT